MTPATPCLWPFADAGTELRSLFENAPVGIAQCDRRGMILAMNSVLSDVLSDFLPTIQHPCLTDLVSREVRDFAQLMFRQLLTGERASFQIESRLLSRSKDEVSRIRWTAWGLGNRGHSPEYVLLLAQNIESRNQQRAIHAEQLQVVGRMAGSVAHDFNNLLTGILLYCDLMRDSLKIQGFAPHDRLRGYVEEIRSAGVQAAGVAQQLLTLTRPRSLDPQALSLNDIAEAMRSFLQRLIGENIELSFHLDPRVGLVKMDTVQAQQILLNLVLNARDAMPAGGRIVVETSNCSVQIFPEDSPTSSLPTIPCALFVVSDNGEGMNEETRRHVFHAYFTTKKEGKGSGLGLATIHDIVVSRGGLVQLDSAPGCGTRVTVLLPSVSAAQVLPATTNQLPQLV